VKRNKGARSRANIAFERVDRREYQGRNLIEVLEEGECKGELNILHTPFMDQY
jgi:hypothetical protein